MRIAFIFVYTYTFSMIPRPLKSLLRQLATRMHTVLDSKDL